MHIFSAADRVRSTLARIRTGQIHHQLCPQRDRPTRFIFPYQKYDIMLEFGASAMAAIREFAAQMLRCFATTSALVQAPRTLRTQLVVYPPRSDTR